VKSVFDRLSPHWIPGGDKRTRHTHDLTTGPIAHHFMVLAVPAAIGMVFNTLYSVVDIFFAGLISTESQAGLSIAFQTFMLLISLGIGLGTAMGALVAGALGRKDQFAARTFAVQGVSFGIIGTLVLMVVGFRFSPDLLQFMTEPGEYRDAAQSYLTILLVALPAFLLAFGANGILQAQGDTVTMQKALMGAFVANIVLDPLFAFGIPGLIPGMGLDGIALSTLVSQSAVMLVILHKVLTGPLLAKITLVEFLPNLARFKDITLQAIPSTFTMIILFLGSFVVQYYLKGFGDKAVAGFGVALRIEQLLLLPGFGLTGALLPIVAQNFGAGHYDRVREALYYCWKVGAAMMLAAAIIFWVGAEWLIGLFTGDAQAIAMGAGYLRIDGSVLPFYIMLFGTNSFLQAIKKPVWTVWIGVYRQGIAIALFCWIFVSWLGFGVSGLWIAIAASVTSGLLLSLIIAEHVSYPIMGGIFPWFRRDRERPPAHRST
jgi:putative MATE family efflux protein